jgi:hypothetical protein
LLLTEPPWRTLAKAGLCVGLGLGKPTTTYSGSGASPSTIGKG